MSPALTWRLFYDTSHQGPLYMSSPTPGTSLVISSSGPSFVSLAAHPVFLDMNRCVNIVLYKPFTESTASPFVAISFPCHELIRGSFPRFGFSMLRWKAPLRSPHWHWLLLPLNTIGLLIVRVWLVACKLDTLYVRSHIVVFFYNNFIWWTSPLAVPEYLFLQPHTYTWIRLPPLVSIPVPTVIFVS